MGRPTLLVAALAALLAACAGMPASRAQPSGGAAGPPPAGDPSANPDMSGFAREVDADGDGRMSGAEWKAKGLPDGPFKMFEAGRGYVTLDDFRRNAAPPGIDLDGDGRLTVAEFREFDRRGAAARAVPNGKR